MSQVRSRDRVVRYGEVMTGEREVNAMLDLVKEECERLESRFLEPACGTGNFLVEILRRKLRSATSARDGVLAVSSLYGIDILQDNVAECRERLLRVYSDRFKKGTNSVRYLLSRNIICGDTLKMVTSEGKPIVFSEWTADGVMFTRRDYLFSEMANRGLFSGPIREYPPVHYLALSGRYRNAP